MVNQLRGIHSTKIDHVFVNDSCNQIFPNSSVSSSRPQPGLYVITPPYRLNLHSHPRPATFRFENLWALNPAWASTRQIQTSLLGSLPRLNAHAYRFDHGIVVSWHNTTVNQMPKS
jgi:hypothetical protein